MDAPSGGSNSQWQSFYAKALRQELKTYTNVILDFTYLQMFLDVKAVYKAYNVDYPGKIAKKGGEAVIFDYQSFLWSYLCNTVERPFPQLKSLTVRELVSGLGQREGI